SDVGSYSTILKSWAKDLPNRQPSPNTKIVVWESNKSLLKLALVSDKNLVSMVRSDPLGTYRDYIKIKTGNNIIDLKQSNGYLVDETNNLLVVPVMMLYPPSAVEQTARVYNSLKQFKQMAIIGPHASNYENYKRVTLDVQTVTYVSLTVFFILSCLLLYYKRYRIYLLIPGVCLSAAISTAITVIVFGSIHGLTISFGVGMLGISFDYGFQSMFSTKNKRKTWLRNFAGLITTLIVLVIIGISEIPLLRQMMFFSTLGLVMAYLIFGVLDKYYSKFYNVKPFHIKPEPRGIRLGGIVTVLLMVFTVLSVFYIKPDFSIGQLDYQDQQAKTTRNILFKNIKAAPLFLVQPDSDILSLSHQILNWSNKNNVRVETLAKYVPTANEQQKNISTWTNDYCKKISSVLKSNNLVIFNDYFEKGICNGERTTVIPVRDDTPAYLKHLESSGRWLTIWFPKDKTQVEMIKQQYPKATSLLDLVSAFPKTLSKELSWKIPVSFLLIIFVLFLYYRSWGSSLLATVPFLSGTGLFLVSAILFKLNITFVSIVGILMIYGFSIDYGIFATDADNKNKHIWSALICAELTTIGGFLPLLFARHPVLVQLGQVLFTGAVGTFIGAFWGIPFIKQVIKRKHEIAK
ncbi:MAG: hypothetical protein NTY22_03670, partial [Proteobacteria bacterium]|nr:hypothetical protein [Pseudomonadota bacterium]